MICLLADQNDKLHFRRRPEILPNLVVLTVISEILLTVALDILMELFTRH